ncbi:MAG: hypothetical protein Q9224_001056 [Gallowayella concinna]
MRNPKHPCPRQRARANLFMIRDEKFLRRLRLKPLFPTPGHILNHQQGAVSNENHIQRSGIVFLEYTVGTFRPFANGSVDGGLDVGAVEVDFCSRGEIVEGTREAEDVPKEGASGGDLVDVEAGVDEGDGVEDVVEEVATLD